MQKYKVFATWVGNVLIPGYEEHLGFVYDPESDLDLSEYHLIMDERWPEMEIYYSDYVRQQFEAKRPGLDFIAAVKENADGLLAQIKADEAAKATQKFDPGEIIVSDGARGLNVDLNHYLQRHLAGDWGDKIPKEDWEMNDHAMQQPNGALYSWYDTSVGRLQIVTYIGHYTSIFLPSEY